VRRLVRLVCAVSLVVVVGAAMPDTAVAQSPVTPLGGPVLQPGSPTRKSNVDWYGWEIFLADGAVVGTALALRHTEPLLILALTGPLVHVAHRRPRTALASLLVRTGLPAAGVLFTALTCDENTDADGYDCFARVTAGFLVASAIALGVDSFGLARKEIEKRPARVEPALVLTPTSTSAGVRIAF
jgi:hypothetical protein